MKKIFLQVLISLIFSLTQNFMKAQCGTFPMSIYVPTLTCAAPTGTIVITTTVNPVTCVWAGPGIVSGGNTLSPIVNVGGLYSYTITDVTTGCASVHPGFLVKSPVSIGYPLLSCSTTTATMTANPSFTATSYLWTGPGIVSGNTTKTITVNAPGYYICTVSNTVTGCQVSGSGSVTSDTFVPAVTINNNTITCAYPTVSLVASSPTFSPSLLNFAWQGTGIVSGATTQTIYVSAAGIYTCNVTNTLNGCVSSITATVSSNASAPAISVAGNTVSCSGQNVMLSASGASTYTWNPGGFTGSSVSVSPMITTIYTITGASPSCTNTGTGMFTVSAFSIPAITATASPTLICAGNVSTLTATGATSYTWMPGWLNGSSVSVTPSVNTNYTVTGEGSGGCMGTKTISVQMAPSPTIMSIANPSVLCSGSSATLIASGATSYTWTPGAISSNSIVVSPTVSTVYTVTGSAANGCTAKSTLLLTMDSFSTLTSGSPITCLNSTTNYTAVGASSYTWSGPGIVSGTNSSVVTINSGGSYTVVGTKGTCIITKVISVIANTVTPILLMNPASTTICAGSNAILSVTSSSAAGSVAYLWNNSATTKSISVNPISTSVYTVTVTYTANGCSSSSSSTVQVNSVPEFSVISNYSVCEGSSAIITASTTADSYTWSTGANATLSITVTPTISQNYTLTGTSTNGCLASQTVSVSVNNSCQDVWPGDANSDGSADNLDVLEMGLHYTLTGPSRATASNNWQSYFANNWTGTITNGKNLNHSDCNGDGTINDNDTLAIYNNYGLTHAFKPAHTTTVTPQLSIVPDQAAVVKGAWGTASIYLGDAATNINNINGVAFTIDFDNTLIETTNIYIEYQNSFLDAGQNLDFRKLDFANGKIFTASTHTVNNNVSGFGKIATLHYKIKSALTTDEVLNIGLSQCWKSDASSVVTPLTSGTGTLMAMGSSVALQELSGNNISVSPNPTNGSLTINSKTELQKIEVLTVTGQIIITEIPTSTSHALHLESFANGIYFVNLYLHDRIVKREKIVVNK